MESLEKSVIMTSALNVWERDGQNVEYELCFMYNTFKEKSYDKTQLLSYGSSMLNEGELVLYPIQKTSDKMNVAGHRQLGD